MSKQFYICNPRHIYYLYFLSVIRLVISRTQSNKIILKNGFILEIIIFILKDTKSNSPFHKGFLTLKTSL